MIRLSLLSAKKPFMSPYERPKNSDMPAISSSALRVVVRRGLRPDGGASGPATSSEGWRAVRTMLCLRVNSHISAAGSPTVRKRAT